MTALNDNMLSEEEKLIRARHSGRVHGIEDMREELMKCPKDGNLLMVPINYLEKIINKLIAR